METYPIIIDGAPAGTLRVEQRGARRAFDADCTLRGDLVRLSVYGGGREGYLGLLAPEGERLTLHRVLSRAELRDFPAEIERVERAGLPPESETPAEPEPAPSSAEGTGCLWTPAELPDPAPGPLPEPGTEAPVSEPAATCQQDAGADTPPETAEAAEPRPTEEAAEAFRWYSSPDGALVSFDGVRSLIALPPEDPRVPPDRPGERRSIEGREYLVYRTKNGRLEQS